MLSGTWRWISDSGAPVWTLGQSAIWTGAEMIVWGTDTRGRNVSGRYDPLADRWQPMATAGEPLASTTTDLLWTGRDVLAWGDGELGKAAPNDRRVIDAGRYDPGSDHWLPVSGALAPRATRHTAVWTGTEMVVFSFGKDGQTVGGRYDPEADAWRKISLSGAPATRTMPSSIYAVWTGAGILAWGDNPTSGPANTVAIYDPVEDVWHRVEYGPSLQSAADMATIWTGSELLVWSYRSATGQRYDPAANRWRAISTAGAPRTRVKASAVWTGRHLVVWGGLPPVFPENVPPGTIADPVPDNLEHGAAYDPTSNSWQALAPLGRKTEEFGSWRGRNSHLSVWTGTEMIVWGGTNSGYHGSDRNDGARWHPTA